ncbi:MAG: amidohydrolase [Bacteroidetes bacterium GWA2_31_9]|nr:MAG: amidohydrolase [Bacteroidetes bacterium GWA2_31_9]
MRLIFLLFLCISIISCNNMKKVDLIITNAKIYTVDSNFSIVQSIAVSDGIIMATGTNDEILKQYNSENRIDLEGKTILPGLYDAHCHFLGYGLNKIKRADLYESKSVEEAISRLKEFSEKYQNEWLEGRGWDQNLWTSKSFPTKEMLDSVFPDIPVYLIRVDGHAAWVNSKALELCNINAQAKVEGGKIVEANGIPTGILLDNAMELVRKHIPEPTLAMKEKALLSAQDDCFAVGLTSVADAGLQPDEILLIDSLQKSGKLKMRIYAMLEVNNQNIEWLKKIQKIITPSLSFRSVKLYADGALGSRGALLLEPYSDDISNIGIRVLDNDFFEKVCEFAIEKGFQVNTHAIGDSAVRTVLNTYSKYLKTKNDLRWRIEHCQVVNKSDFDLFGKYSIIPSVQPTHATSDMGWAEQRLGNERINGAYAYKKLLEQNGWIANGSDFPIENINPFFGIYAAVTRKNADGKPENGFMSENALDLKQAIRATTIWATKAAFEENEKGSLEVGKYADFIVIDNDILNIPESEIFKIKVIMTFVSGKKVFAK